jgi:hypothetical protein
VNPEGEDTSYRFQYGSAECSSGPCASTPGEDLGSAAAPRTATAALSGLAPDTTYHYRLLATNASSPPGGTVGPEATFTTTHGFGFLPGAAGFQVTTTATESASAPDTSAGSHPFTLTATLGLNLAGVFAGQPGVPFSDGDLRDIQIDDPPGLIENPEAASRCTLAQFHTPRSSPYEPSLSGESCPDRSQIGVVAVHTSLGGGAGRTFGLFDLAPPPGAPSQIGFAPYGVPIVLTPHVRQAGGEYDLALRSAAVSERLDLTGLELTVWGAPWKAAHDGQRGNCLNEAEPASPFAACPVHLEPNHPEEAYLTLPTSCSGPLSFSAAADSWQRPGAYLPDGEPDLSDPAWRTATSTAPESLAGCEKLSFAPEASVQPTDEKASSPSGLRFHLEVNQGGLLLPSGHAPSPPRKAVLTLPEGMTIDPSLGAGLGFCAPAGYAAETVTSAPGAGCPNDSKIGDFSLQTPLLEGPLRGAIFLAQPSQNPFGTLLALYLVAKAPERGLIVKVAGRVDPNPRTGQLTASFDQLPQLPYSHLNVDFREGQRSPFLTPSECGSHSSQIELVPWLGTAAAVHQTSTFQLNKGIGPGESCPAPGPPPFAPGAQAGDLNSYAGAYTPFHLHLTRTDAEQEITSYSVKLPPGLLGNLSGVPFCPEAAIAAAKAESGTETEEHPPCSAASEIGRTYSGFGVGGVLAYAPGRLYLAGPYHGAPLSILAVDAARVGPFDLGTIVVRSAIEIDPRSAQVSVDSTASDPIPHILAGIPLHLRDVRVYIDRPDFTLNPTSCDPFSVASTLTGSAAPFTDPRDVSATTAVPFQASFCSQLGFKPKLSLSLIGAAKQGDSPRLKAVVKARPGDANIAAAAVTLPPSILLEQAHIRRPCTESELRAEACRPEAIYGHAIAVTPLLGVPMEGPVYLRSTPQSTSGLPDLVAVLHGQGIRIVLDGRIDSSHSGIRATFEGLPDAPLTSFTMVIFGGRKRGILAAGEDLCASPQIATARFLGQNNAGEALHPRLAINCASHRAHHRRRLARAAALR